LANRLSTTESHAIRIDRALRYLARHLDEDLPLERVASVACFSACHFHRIWHGMLGETLAETVRRLRLQRAAVALLGSGRTVEAIAREAGFGSVPPFARAFRAAFGVPPIAYRRGRGLGASRFVQRATTENDPMHDVTIEERPALRLATLAHRGPYEGIGTAFDRLNVWGQARGLIGPETRFIGIYHDEPEVVPVDKLRSEAGITVPSGFVVPEGEVRLVEVPAGRSAVLRFRGPYAELEAPYRFLYGTWLPGSGEEADEIPCLEEYLNDPKELPPSKWLTAIHLPLRRASAVRAA